MTNLGAVRGVRWFLRPMFLLTIAPAWTTIALSGTGSATALGQEAAAHGGSATVGLAASNDGFNELASRMKAELPLQELTRRRQLVRFAGVSQAAAEQLLAGAQAGAFFALDGAAWVLTDEDPNQLLARVETAPLTAGAGPLSVEADLIRTAPVRLESEEVSSLGEFVDAVAATYPNLELGTHGPFILFVPSSSTASAPGTPAPSASSSASVANPVVFSEGFEADVWDRWWRLDEEHGDFSWGPTSCDAHSGIYSLDGCRGGTFGPGLDCSEPYPEELENWLIGRYCLHVMGAALATLEGYASIDVSPGRQDFLGVYLGRGDGAFYGYAITGYDLRWWHLKADLKNWYYLGDLTQRYCNQLVFKFTSGYSAQGHGVRIDDISVTTEPEQPPTCGIVASPSAGPAPLLVDFTPQVSGFSGQVDYHWSFPDGTVSNNKDPRYVFGFWGTFPVTLRVRDENQECAATTVVNVGDPCSFTCGAQVPQLATSNTPVHFSATVTKSGGTCHCLWIAGYNWRIFDKRTFGSTNRAESYSFSEPGEYHWELTATGRDNGACYGIEDEYPAGPPFCYQTGTITISAPCEAPRITSEPQDQTIVAGGGVLLAVEASGSGPLLYQWYLGSRGDIGQPVTGAESNQLALPTLASTSQYWVRVSNSCGQVDSRTATVKTLPAVPGSYDFGRPESPVAVGFVGVTPLTAYSAATGCGWRQGTINARDRARGSYLTRDFNFTTSGTFAIDMPNGQYQVRLTLGDASASHDQMGVFLEGTQVDTINTQVNEFVTRTFETAVTDEQLTVELRDLGGKDSFVVLNGLELLPHVLQIRLRSVPRR